MTDEIGADESGVPDLPATIADVFLALVGVVVIMLLALAPLIRTPAALAGGRSIDETLAAITIDGARPLSLLADASGLGIEGQAARRVPLDRMRDDAGLAAALREAVAKGQPVLLAIAPDGQEAAFVFESLASGLGVGDYYQLRVDAACDYAIDAGRAGCRPGRVPA